MPAARFVELEDLAQENRVRPAVEQHVVMAPEELVAPLAQPDQCQPQERCGGNVEAPAAVGFEERFPEGSLIGSGKAPPVVAVPGQGHAGADHLERGLRATPDEGRAQNGVTVHQLLASLLESRYVQLPV